MFDSRLVFKSKALLVSRGIGLNVRTFPITRDNLVSLSGDNYCNVDVTQVETPVFFLTFCY